MLDHFTSLYDPNFLSQRGLLAPPSNPSEQRGAHPPSGTPLIILLSVNRAEKTLNVFPQLSYCKTRQNKSSEPFLKVCIACQRGGCF